MNRSRERRAKAIRPGFTVVEVMVVSGLMSLLVLLLSGMWSGLGRPAVDTIIRCRIAQEANLAVDSLAHDFGGSLAGTSSGERKLGRMVGRMVVGGTQLWLCFDGEPINHAADWAAPDTVIVYDVQDSRLIRSDQQAGTAVAVATNIEEMELTEQADGVAIDLTFEFRCTTRIYSIVAKDP